MDRHHIPYLPPPDGPSDASSPSSSAEDPFPTGGTPDEPLGTANTPTPQLRELTHDIAPTSSSDSRPSRHHLPPPVVASPKPPSPVCTNEGTQGPPTTPDDISSARSHPSTPAIDGITDPLGPSSAHSRSPTPAIEGITDPLIPETGTSDQAVGGDSVAATGAGRVPPPAGTFEFDGPAPFITPATVQYLHTIPAGQRWQNMVASYLRLEEFPITKGVRISSMCSNHFV